MCLFGHLKTNPHLFAVCPVCAGSGTCYPAIKACVYGSEVKIGHLDDVSFASRSDGDSGSTFKQTIKLLFCAAGLQVRVKAQRC